MVKEYSDFVFKAYFIYFIKRWQRTESRLGSAGGCALGSVVNNIVT